MNDLIDSKTIRQWAMFMHFSILASFVIPVGGLIAPIVMWQMKKEEYEGIDQHGKNIANFVISIIIYAAVSTVLILVGIGLIVLPVILIASIVLPIIAGIKANNGECWKYPLTIEFLK